MTCNLIKSPRILDQLSVKVQDVLVVGGRILLDLYDGSVKSVYLSYFKNNL